MSGSITPTTGSHLNAFTAIGARAAADGKRADASGAAAAAPHDQVTVSGPSNALLLADAVSTLDLALGAGRDAATLLASLRDSARDGDLAAATEQFAQLSQTLAQGGPLLHGESLSVVVDSNGAALALPGVNAQAGGPVVSLQGEQLGDSGALSKNADDSLARLDAALAKLSTFGQKLSAHASVLAGADNAQGATDLDADGARLLALNVRQGLAGQSAAMANSDPQRLLALFRE